MFFFFYPSLSMIVYCHDIHMWKYHWHHEVKRSSVFDTLELNKFMLIFKIKI